MHIRTAKKDDIPVLLELFKKAYAGMDCVPEIEFFDFKKSLNGAFDITQIYQLQFFVMEEEKIGIVAFAAIAECSFMNGSWELRWGTTHPDFQKQGLMTRLTEYRVNFATKKNKGVPGIVQIASRQPNLYKKIGFETVFERNIDNYVMYLIKEI